jgi:nucleoid-associated protein YgaU
VARHLRLVSAALLGLFFLGLALAVTPSPAPAAHKPQLHIVATVDMRPMNAARARITAAEAPTSYVVRSGDTLWWIARQFYGSGRLWPALWWVNRHRVHNPAALLTGTELHLSPWHPHSAALYRRAVAAIPAPPPPPAAAVPAPPPAGSAPVQPAVPVTTGAGAPGSFQACVIARESGGNPQAVNPSSGAGGLYQFLPSTWAALGHSGLPENASVAEQNQAFQQAYAQSGTSPWAPSDGC